MRILDMKKVRLGIAILTAMLFGAAAPMAVSAGEGTMQATTVTLATRIYSNHENNTDSINLTDYIPEGYGSITKAQVTYTSDSGTVDLSSGPVVNKDTYLLTYTIGKSNEVGKGTITVVVSTADYADITIKIPIETKNFAVVVEATVNGESEKYYYTAAEFGNAIEFAENNPGAVLIMLESSTDNWQGKEIYENNADFTIDLNGKNYGQNIVVSGGKVTIKDANGNGTLSEIEITAGTVNLESGTVTSVDANDGTFNVNGGTIGDITLEGGQLNWNSSTASATGTITYKGSGKINVNQIPTSTLLGEVPSEKLGEHIYSNHVDNTDSINLTTYLPKDCGSITGTTVTRRAVNGTVNYTTEPTVDKDTGILTYTISQNSNVGKETIKVVLSTANNMNITFNVSVETKDLESVKLAAGSAVTLSNSTLTVGEKLSTLTFNMANFVDEGNNSVSGTLSFRTPDTVPDVGTLEAEWIFEPEGTSYAPVYGLVTVTVKDKTSSNSGSSHDSGEDAVGTNDSEATTEPTPITITYTVKKDDYMRKIAREHGITLDQLIALNPQVKNPNLIYAGQVLVISTTGTTAATAEITATKTYTVQRGDSLYKIARKNGMTLAELKSLNENLFAQKYIFAGQQVLLK